MLPSYDVGGDWFDHVDNPDGSWLGIADAAGTGPAAAALAAIALGAFRSARRQDADLRRTVQAMHDTINEVGGADDSVAVTIARWHGASSTFSWISCATPRPMLIDTNGTLRTLGASTAPLGAPVPHRFEVDLLRVSPGERIVLASDGAISRVTQTGDPFGTDGIRAAAVGAPPSSASSTLKAIEDALLSAAEDPLDDDATLIVLAPNYVAGT